ncbi:RNA polymerase sigma factor [Spirosoma rhododendri]|uniref:RNA polymerase sigma factor n=1 Tax=Spirosoma rhododendri TaxID=2728024 RepID=UPI0038CD4EE4
MNEQELWQAFQAGDEGAYTQLYQQHIKAMYRYGMSLVAVSESFVLDCIHDVFTELWAKRTRLSTPDNIRYYLLRALKNRIMHLLERKERPLSPLLETDYDALWAEPDADLLDALETADNQQQRLQRLIAQLPPRQQEALKLRFVENMNYDQIGAVLAVNQQSAKNLVFRAVEKLRRLIISISLIFQLFFWV